MLGQASFLTPLRRHFRQGSRRFNGGNDAETKNRTALDGRGRDRDQRQTGTRVRMSSAKRTAEPPARLILYGEVPAADPLGAILIVGDDPVDGVHAVAERRGVDGEI